jgi:Ca2+-binding EF-hand superfamily protein
MNRRLKTCFYTLTALTVLLMPWGLNAAPEEPEGNPDQVGKPQQKPAMGAGEGYRAGKRMGARQERARAMMERLDSDGDRRISLDEFQQPEKNPFAEMDGNDNGELTLKEMKKFQIRKLEERIEKHFAQLDSDGDDRVTMEEMRQDRFASMDQDGDGYLTPRELFGPRGRRPGPPRDGPPE